MIDGDLVVEAEKKTISFPKMVLVMFINLTEIKLKQDHGSI